MHVIYVVPSDRADAGLDTNGLIQSSVEAWQNWLRAQTGGRGLLLDTYQGQPDISFARLSQTDAAISSSSLPSGRVASEIAALGFDSPEKIYALYYDGSGAAPYYCGYGGPDPIIFLENCAGGNDLWQARDFVMLHEIVHSLGYVPPCAPHSTGKLHVNDSSLDLMWGDGGSGWSDLSKMQLDVGHDDYFMARIPGCLDLSGSRFLEGGGATLTVVASNQRGGRGSVTGWLDGSNKNIEPPTIACSNRTCSAGSFDTWPVQTVTLTAEPTGFGDEFVGWAGACSGRHTTCRVALDASKTVSATFRLKPPRAVRITIIGSGRVTSKPAGLSCSTSCSAHFPVDVLLTLRAKPSRGWRFVRWGDRSVCNPGPAAICAWWVDYPRSLRATFARRVPRR